MGYFEEPYEVQTEDLRWFINNRFQDIKGLSLIQNYFDQYGSSIICPQESHSVMLREPQPPYRFQRWDLRSADCMSIHEEKAMALYTFSVRLLNHRYEVQNEELRCRLYEDSLLDLKNLRKAVDFFAIAVVTPVNPIMNPDPKPVNQYYMKTD